MIKGITRETMARTFLVSGEGPVDRPFSATRIVVDEAVITYERTDKYGWMPRHIAVRGYRAKADGTAGGQYLGEDWYFDPARNTWGHGKVPPALWLTVLAANTCPDGPALEPLPTGDPVDLDAES